MIILQQLSLFYQNGEHFEVVSQQWSVHFYYTVVIVIYYIIFLQHFKIRNFFFSEFVIAFFGKVPRHYLISQLLRMFLPELQCTSALQINNGKGRETAFRARSDISSQSSRKISDISLQKGRVTVFL